MSLETAKNEANAWIVLRGILDFPEFQVQRGLQETLERLVQQEAEVHVVLKDTPALQDAEVWLVQMKSLPSCC